MALEVKQAEHSDPGGLASLLRHLCDDEGEGSILLPQLLVLLPQSTECFNLEKSRFKARFELHGQKFCQHHAYPKLNYL